MHIATEEELIWKNSLLTFLWGLKHFELASKSVPEKTVREYSKGIISVRFKETDQERNSRWKQTFPNTLNVPWRAPELAIDDLVGE